MINKKRIVNIFLCLLMVICSIFSFAACNDEDDPKSITSISVVYTQGEEVVDTNTSLDELKNSIVVTLQYSDGTTETITDYTLSGTLTEGESVITVSYKGFEKTFTVNVSEELDASHSHTLKKNEAKTATCTIDGNIEYWSCSLCGKYYADQDGVREIALAETAIEASHNLTHHEAKTATCTADGNIEYWSCSACSKNYSDANATTEASNIVIEAAHTGGTEIRNSKSPSETEEGYTGDTYCLGCDEKIATGETVDMLEHTHVLTKTNAISATCTENGNVEYWSCSSCGKHYADQDGVREITLSETVIAASHNLTHHEAKSATCTADGNIEYWSCSACNKNYSDANATTEIDTVVIAASHNLTHHEAKSATCTADGNIEYWSCSACGKNYSDANATTEIDTVVIAASHNLTHYEAKTATCTENGNIEYWSCSACSKSYSDANATAEIDTVVIAASHNLTHHETIAPKCEEDGAIEHWECESCHKHFGDSNGDNEILDSIVKEAIGHNYDSNNICLNCNQFKPTEGLKFTYDSISKTYSVSAGTASDANVVIPNTYDGFPVTKIDASGFKNYTNLKSIIIPTSITIIGKSAFEGCCSLEIMTLPFVGSRKDGVSNTHFGYIFGASTYSDNKSYLPSSLKTIIITDGSMISDNAFYNCTYIESITVSDSVVSIGSSTFYNCTNLKTIIFAEDSKIEVIGSNSAPLFGSCTSLVFNQYDNAYYLGSLDNPYMILIKAKSQDITSCKIHNDTKLINYGAFENCTNLKTVTFAERGNLEIIGHYSFSGCIGLESITIPASVRIIYYGAFSNHSGIASSSKLHTISFSAGSQLETIGSMAFNGCLNLESITIPSSVKSIGSAAFSPRNSNSSIYISDIAAWCNITFEDEQAHPLYENINPGRHKLYLNGELLTSLTIPNGVTAIKKYAFLNCENLTYVSIPSSVTSIGSHAFYNCHNLRSINIPNSVTSIGTWAFYSCIWLNNVSFADESKLNVIDAYAFYFCTKLESIEIPDSVTSIGGWVFKNCESLRLISIPSSIIRMGDGVFENCSSIAFNEYNNAYYLGNAENNYLILVKVKNNNFESCKINESTKIICTGAFDNCENLQYTEYDNACYFGTIENPYLILVKATSTDITSCEIHNDTKFINNFAFNACTELETITVPSSVTNIGSHAFKGCTKLREVYFGNESQLTEIGASAFEGCINIETVTIPASVMIIGNSAFNACVSLKEITFAEGSKLNIIDNSAFYGCTNLESITIPASVTIIGNSAFNGCAKIKTVGLTRESKLETIGVYAFFDCTNLETITIPASVRSIGNDAFRHCYKLVEVYNLSSFTFIRQSVDNGYIGCYALSIHNSIESASNFKKMGDYTFYEDKNNGAVYLISYDGNESILVLPTLDNGKTYSIYKYAFYNNRYLSSVTIPSCVTEIGEYAFRDCHKLIEVYNLSSYFTITKGSYKNGYVGYYALDVYTSLDSPTKLKENGDYTFYEDENAGILYLFSYSGDASNLILPTLADEKTYGIYSGAFYNNKKITSITIPSCVTEIGIGAFAECTSLDSITLPFVGATKDGTTNTHFGYIFGASSYSYNDEYVPLSLKTVTITGGNINDSAFRYCYSLQSVMFAESIEIETIGAYAFYNCTSLDTITIPSSVVKICDYAFSGCSKLGTVVFEAESMIETIGASAFSACTALESITIPDSTTNIGNSAFAGCINLKNVTFNEGSSLKTIGNSAFSRCNSLKSITIPMNVESIGSSAFYECYSLVEVYNLSSYIVVNKGETTNGYIGYYAMDIYNSLDDSSKLKEIGQYTFYEDKNTGKLYLVGYNGDESILVLPTLGNGQTYIINNYAFYKNQSITSVTIPSCVTEIGIGAFAECTSLDSITLPFVGATKDGTTNTHFGYIFGASSYSYNDEYVPSTLKTVIVEGGSKIANYAFSGCSSVDTIIIPTSVIEIGKSAFNGCDVLRNITLPFVGATKDGTSNTHFGYIFGANSYSSNPNYVSESLETVIITGGTKIADYAFYNCNALISIIVPKNITSIGNYAFYGCTFLKGIVIPDQVTKIGSYAFYNCTNLEFVTVSEKSKLQTIGSRAFYNCATLTQFTIPTSVTSIGSSAFQNCYKLVEIFNRSKLTITKGSTGNGYIGCYALNIYTLETGSSSLFSNDDFLFYNDGTVCYLLGYFGQSNEIVLPEFADGTEYAIYKYAFAESSIIKVTIPLCVTNIGDYAFNNCVNLRVVTINEGSNLKTIGDYSFNNCSALTSIALPKQVTHIGKYAFYNCQNISNITLPQTLVAIGDYAFNHCSAIQSIAIPAVTTNIGKNCFDGSTMLFVPFVATPNTWDSSWNAEGCVVLYGCDGVVRDYTFVTNGGTNVDTITAVYIERLPSTKKENYYFLGWYDNAEFVGEPVTSHYYSATHTTLYAKWLTQEEYFALFDGSSFEKAILVETNQSNLVTIDTGGEYYYFKFIPSESKSYTIYAESDTDTYGYLYSEQHSQLASNDDSGDGRNFLITYDLIAYETYYIGAKFYSSSNTGTFTVVIE